MGGELVTEIIRKCLTPCLECTGRYVSKVLGKRFVCHCPCHHHDKLAINLRECGLDDDVVAG